MQCKMGICYFFFLFVKIKEIFYADFYTKEKSLHVNERKLNEIKLKAAMLSCNYSFNKDT